jgi:ABC-type phosphate/phosphonate transport system substrate-binding protein
VLLTAPPDREKVPAMPSFSLPMYDWPEVRDATDAWALGLARHLRAQGFLEAPLQLLRGDDYSQAWQSSELILSQCCGYHLVHPFAGALTPVLTPHYAVEGCSGPAYSSFVFVRSADVINTLADLRGRISAINDRESMSGMLALKLVFGPLTDNGKFFAGSIETGAHARSLAAVLRGEADVCAVDPICVALARRHRPELLAGLTEIARSPLVPGLPYVTARHRSPHELARMRQAIAAAFADPELQPARDALFLSGCSPLDRSDYAIIAALERNLESHGGLALWETAA